MNKTNSPVVIVDSDAIVAQAHPQDSNHQSALAVLDKLNQLSARLIYPITAITEAVTVLQHKLSSTATAYGTAIAFTNPEVEVMDVSKTLYTEAISKNFHPTNSKKDTVFDCIILETAKKLKADAVFSFDKFYKKSGFKLASEL